MAIPLFRYLQTHRHRTLVAYGFALAALLLGMKWLEYRFLLVQHSFELYAGLIALVFTALGIWLAGKLTAPKIRTVIIEKEIQATIQDDFAESMRAEEISRTGLSKRELDVLEQMAQGLSNQEIAEKLHVSLNTIKTHTARILEKLEASRRTQAVDIARKRGIIS
ncbi:MAG TPA: response regulator transcription factor [Catalimonadaceae bacterium]|nr:response regulator transcription factor [Catalimonadaceae bacterium]